MFLMIAAMQCRRASPSRRAFAIAIMFPLRSFRGARAKLVPSLGSRGSRLSYRSLMRFVARVAKTSSLLSPTPSSLPQTSIESSFGRNRSSFAAKPKSAQGRLIRPCWSNGVSPAAPVGDKSSFLRRWRARFVRSASAEQARLVKAVAVARSWREELMAGTLSDISELAKRERRTERSIRMALSLAFLDPAIIEAAVEGRLPRGFGISRLADLPMAFADQWSVLGLSRPA